MPKDEALPDIAETADLYTLPLTQFTEARDGLAAWLRSEGSTEEAARVGKLRKPSVAAWALNRVARLQPEQVDRLLDSHRQLRHSGSADAMQTASEVRRQAVASLVEAAMAELRAVGRPDSLQNRDRINRTLLAVATDPEGEADLKAGTLVREIDPSGGGWGDMTLPSPPSPDPGLEAGKAAGKARARAEKLETEAAEAERRLESAKQAVAEARRRAKAARVAADQAADEARQAEDTARGLGG
jgi:hypothetical protein